MTQASPPWAGAQTASATTYAQATDGATAVIHYTIHLRDGSRISTHETGVPYRFEIGASRILPGLDAAVREMGMGETRRIHLTARQAFGEHDASRVLLAAHDHISSDEALYVGQPVRVHIEKNGRDHDGLEQAFIRDAHDDGIVFDLNHPLAGQELIMDVTLLAVE